MGLNGLNLVGHAFYIGGHRHSYNETKHRTKIRLPIKSADP